MNERFDLVTIGEPLIGLYPVDGEPELACMVHGGDTSNAGLAAARLGLKTAFAGAVGDDPYGDSFRRLWKERDVDTSLLCIDSERFTGLYVISFGGGDHKFAYYRKGSAASTYLPDEKMRQAIRTAQVVHVSGISQAISVHMTELIFDLLKEAKSEGALISYDVNYRPGLWTADHAGAIVDRTIRQFADIVSTNADELKTLGLAEDSDAFYATYADYVRLIAVRDGANGATGYTRAGSVHVAAFSVDVADTVGAGDSFDAGLISAYLRDLSPEECLRYANAVAAITCTARGSTKGHPDHIAVERLIREGKYI